MPILSLTVDKWVTQLKQPLRAALTSKKPLLRARKTERLTEGAVNEFIDGVVHRKCHRKSQPKDLLLWTDTPRMLAVDGAVGLNAQSAAKSSRTHSHETRPRLVPKLYRCGNMSVAAAA